MKTRIKSRLVKWVLLLVSIAFIFEGVDSTFALYNEARQPGETSPALSQMLNQFSVEKDYILPGVKKAGQLEYVPGEIIIKFKDEGGALLDRQLSTSKLTFDSEVETTQTGISSLNILNSKYRVFSMAPIFKTLKQKQLKYNKDCQALFQEIKDKFPQRTKRAPKDAGVPKLFHIYKLCLKDKDTDIYNICQEYSKDPNVEYAEPNYIYKVWTLPNDTYVDPDQDGDWSHEIWGPDYEDMWGLKKIGYEETWTTGYLEGAGVNAVVAIVDSGIDRYHLDLQDSIWVNQDEIPDNGIDDDNNGFIDDTWGWNFSYSNNNPIDDYGHGSHVAGTIGATTNNSEGIAGVTTHVDIMAVKGLNSVGGGSSSLANSIIYATENGADVISNSWGAPGSSSLLEDAVRFAIDAGCIVVAAAGNDSADAGDYTPAGITDVLTVAATNYNDERSSFSNWGESVEVSAPGQAILSIRANGTGRGYPVDDRYTLMSGTSMACPHVSGLAAFLVAYSKNEGLGWDRDEIVHRIMAGSKNINPLNPDYAGLLGTGRINVYNSINVERGPDLRYLSSVINDSGGDGKLDPGESASITISLKNYWQNATSVTAILTTDNSGVNIVDAYAGYGDIPEGITSKNKNDPFIIELAQDIEVIKKVHFILTLQSNGGSYVQQEDLFFDVGKVPQFIKYSIDDDHQHLSSGDGDGIVEPGEIAELVVKLFNENVVSLEDILLRLTAEGNVTLLNQEARITHIEPNSKNGNYDDPFLLRAPDEMATGELVSFTLEVFFRGEKVLEMPFLIKLNSPLQATSLGDSWSSNADQIEPAVACDTNGTIYAVWRDSRYHTGDGDILFSKSTDGGETFTSPVLVNTTRGYMNAYPRIAVDDVGNIYVTWVYVPNQGRNEEGLYDFEIYFAKSTDGGNSFVYEQRISNPETAYDLYEPRFYGMAVYNLDVYVVWSDERTGKFAETKIYFTHSTNGGVHFESDIPLPVEGGIENDARWPNIAIDLEGNIYVSYTAGLYLHLTKSIDQGSTFSESIQITGDTGELQSAVNIEAPEIDIIHLVWHEAAGPGRNHAYYTQSQDGGQTFGIPIRIDSVLHGWSQDRPTIAVSPSGKIFATISEYRSDGLGFYCSEDSGISFSPRQSIRISNVGDFISWRSSVEADNANNCLIVWDEYVRELGPQGMIKVSLAKKADNQQVIGLRLGWNFIGLFLETDTSYTASSLLAEIVAQGGNCVEIARWYNGTWQYYPADGVDFTIEPYKGYFVRCNISSHLTITGIPLPFDISNLDITVSGWHAISVPVDGIYTAESICQAITANYPGGCLEIDRWQYSGWDGHVTDFPFNNFSIERGRGYFVKYGLPGQSVIPNTLSAPGNHKPRLTPIGDYAIEERKFLKFIVSATDLDGDGLSYSASNLPNGASFKTIIQSSGSKVGQFSWQPTYDQSGEYSVIFTVSDGELTDPETITITVINVNRSPVAKVNATPMEGYAPLTVKFKGSDSYDPDGDKLTYLWKFGNDVTSTTPDPVYTYKVAGTYKATLKVIDPYGASSEASIIILVKETNTAPVIRYLRNYGNKWIVWYGWGKEDRWNITYSYKIDNGKWSSWSRTRWLYIPSLRLSRGQHRFYVKARDSKGLESEIKFCWFYVR